MDLWLCQQKTHWRYRNNSIQDVALEVGKAKQHEVFEGEAAGLVMAMELVRREKKVREVSIYADNQAAITATGTDAPGSARHIIDMVHRQHQMLQKRHKRAWVTIRWIPGHSDVAGNEEADRQAKRAAKGETSTMETIPACLRKPLPISKAAARREFRRKLTEAAARTWATSQRYRKFSHIDPALSIANFRKTVKDMPKQKSATLVQLRTGHIALNAHLHRIGKADTPTCLCCRRANETVEHFILHCLAHAIPRRRLQRKVGRDAHNIQKLLSDPHVITHLLDYVTATGRLAKQGVG